MAAAFLLNDTAATVAMVFGVCAKLGSRPSFNDVLMSNVDQILVVVVLLFVHSHLIKDLSRSSLTKRLR